MGWLFGIIGGIEGLRPVGIGGHGGGSCVGWRVLGIGGIMMSLGIGGESGCVVWWAD